MKNFLVSTSVGLLVIGSITIIIGLILALIKLITILSPEQIAIIVIISAIVIFFSFILGSWIRSFE
jgi:hypothetical protein